MSSPYPTSLNDYGNGIVPTGDGINVASTDVRTIVEVTQAAYDLLTPDPETLYVIVG